MERLTIENFAGIKELDLEVKPFTVLIGPQSVGKSITAKLLYFFKSLPRGAYIAVINENPNKLDEIVLNTLKAFLPDPTHQGTKCVLTYTNGNNQEQESLRLSGSRFKEPQIFCRVEGRPCP